MPAKAGIHGDAARWTPASAGVEKRLGVLAPWRFIIFVFLLFHFSLPAFARPLEQVKESGAIALCAHPNALPFSAKEGARHGFQIELGAAIAKEMGVGFETHWAVAAHDLNRADCDFVLDAIADPEAQDESRLKLSKPYGGSGVTLAVRGDDTRIHGLRRSRRRRQDRHSARLDGGDVSRPPRHPHLARRFRVRASRRGRVGRACRRGGDADRDRLLQ